MDKPLLIGLLLLSILLFGCLKPAEKPVGAYDISSDVSAIGDATDAADVEMGLSELEMPDLDLNVSFD